MEAIVMIEALGAALMLGGPCDQGHEAARLLRGAGFAVVDASGDEYPDTTDLVVLCSEGSVGERIRAVEHSVAGHPDVPVLATMPAASTGAQLRKAVRAGAGGIVLDDQLAQTIAATASGVAAGQLVVPRSLARRLAPRPLSHREKEIMGLVVRGHTNRQIAAELFLAESTVKTHLSSALRKLDARSRAEAAALVLDPEEGHGLAILSLLPEPRKIEAAASVD